MIATRWKREIAQVSVPSHVPNVNDSFFSLLIASHQHQTTTPSRVSTTYKRIGEIPENKCLPFRPSHPLLFSPSLRLSPLSISAHQRSSLAAARQLYAFIDNTIFNIQSLHFTNNFPTFFFLFSYIFLYPQDCVTVL